MFDKSKEPYFKVPDRLLNSLNEWGKRGTPTGGFLRSVLENDLFSALAKADLQSRSCIFEICMYIRNELPRPCFGSKEAVKRWDGLSEDVVDEIERNKNNV